jgi:hypothetical protein
MCLNDVSVNITQRRTEVSLGHSTRHGEYSDVTLTLISNVLSTDLLRGEPGRQGLTLAHVQETYDIAGK